MNATARYVVIRVPTTGPPALIAPPNDFATRAEAEARITEIERPHRKQHHTYLDVFEYQGDRTNALEAAGIRV
jgi:hypothetical protein